MPAHHHPLQADRISLRSALIHPAGAKHEAGAGGTNSAQERATNALGQLLIARLAEPESPCHSYSEVARRSGVSREALSRYVSVRHDRHRSPTMDTLAGN